MLAHVDSEEAALRLMVRVLEEVPIQFLNSEQHRTLKARVEAGVLAAETLAVRRHEILQALGTRLGLSPDEMTFTRIIASASPDAVPLLVQARARLKRVLIQILGLRQVVACVIHESNDMNSLLIQELMGQTTSDRYNASGRRAIETALIQFQSRS